MNRWIMYASQNFPGSMSFRVTCHQSLEWCIESLERFSRSVGTDNVSATLYAFDDEAWRDAMEYREIGCPFDYPDRMIERGPRGALRVVRC